MLKQEFEDGLRAVTSFNMRDLELAGVIEQGDTGAWVDFTRNPYRWVSHLPPARSEKMWALLEQTMPVRTVSEESADALHDVFQLAQDHGWDGVSLLTTWLRERIAGYAQRGDSRRGIYVVSKARHAPTWRVLRSSGVPIISTWIDQNNLGAGDLLEVRHRSISEASTADVLVVYLMPGETLKSAWADVGAALAWGIPVYAVVGDAPELRRTDGIVTHFPNLDAAIDAARRLVAIAA